jgi:hypothetical protein
MTVKEYREKEPNCRYCKYSCYLELGFYMCNAKEKFLLSNKAKKCEVYQAKEL